MFGRMFRYLSKDIWRVRIRDLPRGKAARLKVLRGFALTVRGFVNDQCALLASALTFYSLLSIVPVMAMAFGIAQGFGLKQYLERQLRENFPAQEEALRFIIDWTNQLLDNTGGGLITGFGIIFLIWSVLKILNNIEESLNRIWKVKEARTYGRKFSDYLAIMLISPILFILSSSATIYITTQIRTITEQIQLIGYFSPVIFFFLRFVPYLVVWVLFSFIYILMPNARVRFWSGVFAGVLAGTLFQFVQWVLISLQIGVARYNAIYGSFAAFPLFLVWLNLSWIIVLLGAEIAYAHQNLHAYELEPDTRKLSFHFRKILSLQISQVIIRQFAQGDPPLTCIEIARMINVPARLVEDTISELCTAGILNPNGVQKSGETTYQPAVDIHRLTILEVAESLEKKGVNELPVAKNRELETIEAALQVFHDTLAAAPANRLLKDI